MATRGVSDMAKRAPHAICYEDAPDQTIGWVCGNEFCLTVYLVQVVGGDAETMAECCCDHPCWKCGAKATQGFVLCVECRQYPQLRAHRMHTSTSRKTTTLTAPEGSIGAIGSTGSLEPPAEQPPENADSGALPP
jgi:hypothetical protein